MAKWDLTRRVYRSLHRVGTPVPWPARRATGGAMHQAVQRMQWREMPHCLAVSMANPVAQIDLPPEEMTKARRVEV
ncbi:hypothetical protein HAX54_024111, partial [Datura stramonium]|nr:hypothetical protein [Datura stramonium]